MKRKEEKLHRLAGTCPSGQAWTGSDGTKLGGTILQTWNGLGSRYDFLG